MSSAPRPIEARGPENRSLWIPSRGGQYPSPPPPSSPHSAQKSEALAGHEALLPPYRANGAPGGDGPKAREGQATPRMA